MDKREGNSPRAGAVGDESERDDHYSHSGNGSDSSSGDESEEDGSELCKRGYDESWWNGNEFKKQQM
jgi:hypothetical protein